MNIHKLCMAALIATFLSLGISSWSSADENTDLYASILKKSISLCNSAYEAEGFAADSKAKDVCLMAGHIIMQGLAGMEPRVDLAFPYYRKGCILRDAKSCMAAYLMLDLHGGDAEVAKTYLSLACELGIENRSLCN